MTGAGALRQVPASKIPPLRIADPQAEHYSRNYQQVLLARPAVSMPVPSPHHGLGLDRYAQVTSPIRRYSDLVLHRIIKAALAAAPPAYSAEDLRLLMPHISQRFSSIQRLQRLPAPLFPPPPHLPAAPVACPRHSRLAAHVA